MIGALAAKKPVSQAEAIRRATEQSVQARNLYTEQTVAALTAMLGDAEDEVRRAILRYKSLGSLPDNKLAALTSVVAGADARPTGAAYQVFRELASRADTQIGQLNLLLRRDIPDFNRMVRDAEIPAVVIRR